MKTKTRRLSLFSMMIIIISFLLIFLLVIKISFSNNKNNLEEVTNKINFEWEKLDDNIENSNCYEAIGQDNSGNYIVLKKIKTFSNYNDYILEKYNKDGEKLDYIKYIDGFYTINKVYFNTDGSYIIIGEKYVTSEYAQTVIKYDDNGNVVWENNTWDSLSFGEKLESGGVLQYYDFELKDITKNSNGDYIVSGKYSEDYYLEENTEYRQYYYGILAIYSEQGNLKKLVKVKADGYDSELSFNSLVVDSDSITAVGTVINGDTSVEKGIIYNFDNDGNINWKHVSEEKFKDIDISDNGGYIVVTQTSIFEYNKSGELIKEQKVNSNLESVRFLNDGRYAVISNNDGKALLSIYDVDLSIYSEEYYKIGEYSTKVTDLMIDNENKLILIGQKENSVDDKTNKENSIILKFSL